MITLSDTEVETVDVSIDEKLLKSHQERIKNEPDIQRSLKETGQGLESQISLYASSNKQGDTMTISEYLNKNPKILQQNSSRDVEIWGKRWHENSRHSTYSEKKFCKQARQLYDGKFGEVFQSVFVDKDGNYKKYLAFSDKADGVDVKDVNQSISSEDLKL